ncbi:hypothetical protein ACSNOH_27835 [Streptomyces sp. URMC 127]|uniref:hypothetical protein n=1 Tax=Streptomyces sp. URMC 127 TaxID=3423402 RepID=UPI003F1A8EE5
MTVAFPEGPEEPEKAEGHEGQAGGAGREGPPGGWDVGADGDPVPEPLPEWQEHGFTIAEARRWIEGKFLVAEAERWRTSGVYTPEKAREWRTAGATPYTVDGWLRAGMTPRDAVRWRELGYSPQEAAERHLAGESPQPRGWLYRMLNRGTRPPDPYAGDPEKSEAMRELLRSGVAAATARGFVESGWSGRDALDWAKRGIEPGDAKLFHALGVSAAEAEKLVRDGEDAVTVVTAWWGAGIPMDEVAAWRGAGFGAEEAAQMRKEGTDVEQAKILRALTEGGDFA